MAQLTYNPRVFRVPDLQAAKAIILTPEGGQTTDQRWERETPYLTDLLGDALRLAETDLIVDFGCGVGRMSKALIDRFGCRVLGVDFSQDMRAMAPVYVASGRFSAVSGRRHGRPRPAGGRRDFGVGAAALPGRHRGDLAPASGPQARRPPRRRQHRRPGRADGGGSLGFGRR